jgi:hypothetical protein
MKRLGGFSLGAAIIGTIGVQLSLELFVIDFDYHMTSVARDTKKAPARKNGGAKIY